MKLTEDMRKIMAWCYQAENVGRYEFVMDKRTTGREDYVPLFTCRLFYTAKAYLSINILDDDRIVLQELHTFQSYWNASRRVTYMNKYFKKFRRTTPHGLGMFADIPDVDTLITILDKIDFNPASPANKSDYPYLMYRHCNRMEHL